MFGVNSWESKQRRSYSKHMYNNLRVVFTIIFSELMIYIFNLQAWCDGESEKKI